MAAAILFRRCWGCARTLDIFCRNTSTVAGSSQKKQNILSYLYSKYYDLERIINWSIRLKQWNLRRKNAHFGYTLRLHGKYVAAAHFVLSRGGAVRFQGQEEWYHVNKRGKFSLEFINHKDVPVEAVDLSGSLVNYDGLENIISLEELKYLNLSNCPNVDDWCLSRLHVFQENLQVLYLAGCPLVTERGLASLHHLQNLKHLDVSNLPLMKNKGLTAILLEETLPQCKIVGMNIKDSADLDSIEHEHITMSLQKNS